VLKKEINWKAKKSTETIENKARIASKMAYKIMCKLIQFKLFVLCRQRGGGRERWISYQNEVPATTDSQKRKSKCSSN